MIERLKAAAKRLKRETYAIYLAARDPRTPWYARVLAAAVAAYAFSPIDLIPDFVPVLGYVDDLLIVPAGLWLAVRMVPAEVLADARARAEEAEGSRPVSRAAAAIVVAVWVAGLAALALWAYRAFGAR